MFQVLDTPKHRTAAAPHGAIVDLGSAAAHQLVGPARARARTRAPLRGIVLGDSFMQGMFIGDDETPPECLGRDLQAD